MATLHTLPRAAAAAGPTFTFTSESVSEGHPDKLCDRVSDAIVDAFLEADPEARLGVETLATTNYMVIAGETRSTKPVSHEQIENIARHAIRDIGYEQSGFSWDKAEIVIKLHEQSVDIAQGVDSNSSSNKDEGAGDQGIMFGYACDETEAYMPAPIYYAHAFLRSLSAARHSGALPMLGPDAKSQISLVYEKGQPVRASSVLISTQHDESVDQEEVRTIVRPHITNILPENWMCDEAEFYVNPTGRFVIGGPDGDCGLTGRKIIVDTYGGAAPHGGGAFSGKDPTKVDRSAAYAARYLAKNVVAAGLAGRCTLQLSYAIGVAKPLSLYVNTHGTGEVDEAKISSVLQELMNLSPRGIRTHLLLNRPIYARTAAYGHFGRPVDADGGFSWERLDLVDELKRTFNV